MMIDVTRSTKSVGTLAMTDGCCEARHDLLGTSTSCSSCERPVDCGEVPLENRFSPLGKCRSSRLLNGLDRLFARQNVRQGEKAGLQDRIDPLSQARLCGHLVAVDDEEPQPLLDDLLLHFRGQTLPDVVRAKRTV